MEKSGNNRGSKRQAGGYGKPPEGKKFSKDYQPPPEALKEGKKKKKFTREILKDLLSMPYRFAAADEKIKKQLVEAYGPEIENMTLGEVMALKQAQKVILSGDSTAFTALFNQAFGLPKQTLGGDPENPLIPVPTLTKEQLAKLIDKI